MTHQDRTLEEQRKQTANLIRHGGQDINLMRPQVTDDGAGGQKIGDPEPMGPVRRFFAAVTADEVPVRASLGSTIVQWFVLIGLHTDDIQKEDFFVIDQNRYEISYIDDDTSFQKKAHVYLVVN